jgi:hypothetical protein
VSLLQSVKTLMPTSGDLPVTRLVEAVMENRASEMAKVGDGGWPEVGRASLEGGGGFVGSVFLGRDGVCVYEI